MLNTNRKEVKEAVRRYITENIEEEARNLDTDIQGICNWYNNGCWGDISIGEFLTNYANVFAFYIDDQKALLKEWLQETDEEANNYNADKVETLFIRLIDREIEKALNIQAVYQPRNPRQPIIYKKVK